MTLMECMRSLFYILEIGGGSWYNTKLEVSNLGGRI